MLLVPEPTKNSYRWEDMGSEWWSSMVRCLNGLKILLHKKYKFKKAVRKIRFPFCETRKKRLCRNVINGENPTSLKLTNRHPKIIISLTTYPPRFNSVTMTLKSLLYQTMRPDKIIVWHNCEENTLTKEMLDYEKYGVEYIKVNDDLGPHKKYYYALQVYSDDIVIVVDDDLIYPNDMVDSLVRQYLKYPHCVCARRVHKLKLNSDGMLDGYDKWIGQCFFIRRPSHMLMATSGAGTLYPPGVLTNRTFDMNMIKTKCLYADDIWMKYFEIISNIKVVWVANNMPMPPEVNSSQSVSLKSDNLNKRRNNCYIDAMNEVYGNEIATILKREEGSVKKSSILEWLEELLGEQISCWGK